MTKILYQSNNPKSLRNFAGEEPNCRMENQPNRTEIAQLGEFGLIDHLTRNAEMKHASTVKGIGDDAAVIDHAHQLTVVSTDMLVEGVHFDMMYTPMQHLGFKAIAVNVSDICAMNAKATHVLVSIAISNRYSVEALEALYEGIHHACAYFDVDLIGGDTTTSLKGLVISVTVFGAAQEQQLAYRNGAKDGDLICVTGDLGAAYVGLQLLEREKNIYLENPNIQPDLENKKHIIGRILRPEARVDIIRFFAENAIVPHAMIDISDGLSSELLHICKQSNCGALIYETGIPIHEETYAQAQVFNIDPLVCALNGGEDYELLFTVPASAASIVEQHEGISVIGKIVPKSEGIQLKSRNDNYYPLEAQGWNAFTTE